ncbi:MAG TPA: hypothetical protein VGL83_07675 [Stellaceae bacterium]|jgi:hypothetical protein
MENREQRLTMRILTIWRSLCQGTTLPRRAQIDPLLFGADWANCLLLDIDPKIDRSRLAFVGDNLRDPSWPPLDRQMMSECEDGTLLQATLASAARVIAKGVPISTAGLVPQEGESIVYRSILLPLAESSGRIDGLLGGASFRLIAVEEEVHPIEEPRAARPQLVAG